MVKASYTIAVGVVNDAGSDRAPIRDERVFSVTAEAGLIVNKCAEAVVFGLHPARCWFSACVEPGGNFFGCIGHWTAFKQPPGPVWIGRQLRRICPQVDISGP